LPFTGGWSPNPERYGAGEGGNGVTLLQRVFESLASQRGDAYDQTLDSAVGVENMAYARAITFEGWGANERVARACNPAGASLATGTLQRWERILGKPPLPGDSERVRRARIVAAWGRIGDPNSIQPMIDALQSALGPVYVGVVHQTLATASSYINGISPVVATGTAPPGLILTGTPARSIRLQVNITFAGPIGTSLFSYSIDGGGTVAGFAIPTGAAVPLGSTGLIASFQPGAYATDNVYTASTAPGIPWTSSIAHIDVQVTYAPAGYHNPDGSPNAQFYQAVAIIAPVLDELLPIWSTFDYFINSSNGVQEFRLDERDLDLEAFGS
jgi:hypothetical protein